MKMHMYNRIESDARSLWFGDKFWTYDVTACGLRRLRGDGQIDAALFPDQVTCKQCQKIIQKEQA